MVLYRIGTVSHHQNRLVHGVLDLKKEVLEQRPSQQRDQGLGTGRRQGVGSRRAPGRQENCLQHGEGMLTALQNLLKSDQAQVPGFTKDRFTSAHAEARAFLSTGLTSGGAHRAKTYPQLVPFQLISPRTTAMRGSAEIELGYSVP